jgi:hypothetical protein
LKGGSPDDVDVMKRKIKTGKLETKALEIERTNTDLRITIADNKHQANLKEAEGRFASIQKILDYVLGKTRHGCAFLLASSFLVAMFLFGLGASLWSTDEKTKALAEKIISYTLPMLSMAFAFVVRGYVQDDKTSDPSGQGKQKK